VLSGVGSFAAPSAGLLFKNSSSNQLAYWNIDASGVVTGTGTLGEAPAGWTILAVGRL
jgi:PDZ domain-containing secreted protein